LTVIVKARPLRSNHGKSLMVVLLVVGAIASSCSGGKTSASPTTIAGRLIFGGPPECVTRITCLLGLQETYGLHFKFFKALDELGPLTVASLASDVVQLVRLDSSDPSIQQHHWVILQDDKSFQPIGNIIPVIRASKATPEVASLLNQISAAMSQGDLFALDREVQLEHMTPRDAARAYVEQKGWGGNPATATKGSLTVGSAAFSENEMLADIYIDVLTGAGYNINSNVDIGSREKYEPALESGHVDLVPEYVGNYLAFLDPSSENRPLSASVSMLRTLLVSKGLTVLDPSSATDSDTIVVTKSTADKFHLTKISDVGKSFPG
jgi:osmoprotectant transport system substrate-binding protein